jgi:hypothetical protein
MVFAFREGFVTLTVSQGKRLSWPNIGDSNNRCIDSPYLELLEQKIFPEELDRPVDILRWLRNLVGM